MLLGNTVTIWRASREGDYHLEWQVSQPGTNVNVEVLAEDGKQLAEHGNATRLSGLARGKRHYFRLSDQYGNTVVVSERRLGFDGSPNFRDFGGYQTQTGQQVKWGSLFRSGHLAELTPADIALVDSLALDLVFDFRRPFELQQDPSRLPVGRQPRICHLPIEPGNHSGFINELAGPIASPQTMFDFMVTVNRELALEEAPVYRQMFEEILARDDACFLVHCSAGKDRTGFAAAVILLALGVSEEHILQDYLLTGRFYNAWTEVARVKQKYGMNHSSSEAVLPMLQVDEAYLGAALTLIRDDFSSVDTYLFEVMGLGLPELAELRHRYLLDAGSSPVIPARDSVTGVDDDRG